MVATVIINELNGAGETATDKTSGTVRMKNADDAAVNTANPMVIPTGAPDFSYQKWLRCYCQTPPDTSITNLQFYTDGANGLGTGVSLMAKTSSVFATPTEVAASAGYTSVFDYTSPASTLDMGVVATVTASGAFGDYLVMMMAVASTATQGTTPSETLTWSYDEI